jgi:hypothetical protein
MRLTVVCAASRGAAAGVLDAEQAYQKRAAVGPTPGLTRQVRARWHDWRLLR